MPIRPGSTTISDRQRNQAGRRLGTGVGHEDHRAAREEGRAKPFPAAAAEIEPGEAEAGHHRPGEVLVREQAAPQAGMFRLQRICCVDGDVGKQQERRRSSATTTVIPANGEHAGKASASRGSASTATMVTMPITVKKAARIGGGRIGRR